jgi:rod shape-determining protein MreB
MLRGLDKESHKKRTCLFYIAEDPLQAVVRGTGTKQKHYKDLKSILIK